MTDRRRRLHIRGEDSTPATAEPWLCGSLPANLHQIWEQHETAVDGDAADQVDLSVPTNWPSCCGSDERGDDGLRVRRAGDVEGDAIRVDREIEGEEAASILLGGGEGSQHRRVDVVGKAAMGAVVDQLPGGGLGEE